MPGTSSAKKRFALLPGMTSLNAGFAFSLGYQGRIQRPEIAKSRPLYQGHQNHPATPFPFPDWS